MDTWQHLPPAEQVKLWRHTIWGITVVLSTTIVCLFYHWSTHAENKHYEELVKHPENLEKLHGLIDKLEANSEQIADKIDQTEKRTEKEEIVKAILNSSGLWSSDKRAIIKEYLADEKENQ